jgi:hypothetical protein
MPRADAGWSRQPAYQAQRAPWSAAGLLWVLVPTPDHDGASQPSLHEARGGWQRSRSQVGFPDDRWLLDVVQLESVDLLKVDCEGGEYELFATAPDAVFERIGDIALEYHAIKGYEACLV